MAETGLVERLRVIADKLLELDRDWQRDIYEAADALAAKEAECGELKTANADGAYRAMELERELQARISALQEQVRGMREALLTIQDENKRARREFTNVNTKLIDDAIKAALTTGGEYGSSLAVDKASERAKDESGWLIEHGASEPSRPRYWGGVHGWTYDNLKAVRFAREIDAQSIAESMDDGVPGNYRILEHGWS